jgi:hypothetical protein
MGIFPTKLPFSNYVEEISLISHIHKVVNDELENMLPFFNKSHSMAHTKQSKKGGNGKNSPGTKIRGKSLD